MSEEKKVVKLKRPVEIILEFPFEYDGQIIDRVILHRPKGKHLKKIGQDAGMEEMLLIACKVIELPGSSNGMGVPNAVINEMDGADCIQVTERISDFLESGRKIGKL